MCVLTKLYLGERSLISKWVPQFDFSHKHICLHTLTPKHTHINQNKQMKLPEADSKHHIVLHNIYIYIYILYIYKYDLPFVRAISINLHCLPGSQKIWAKISVNDAP